MASLANIFFGGDINYDDSTTWRFDPDTKQYTPDLNFVSTKEVAPGTYGINHDDQIGYYLTLQELTTDSLYVLNNNKVQTIIDEVERFWNNKELYKEFNYLYRRSILLYGEPATSKTSTINIVTNKLIDDGGVVIKIVEPEKFVHFYEFIKVFRRIEPDRKLIVTIEDIDTICESEQLFPMLLDLLDGSKSIDNVLYIFTTNYVEKLQDSLLERPTRIDVKFEMDYATREEALTYLGFKNIEGTEIVDKLEGRDYTIAHIKEIIIKHKINGMDLDEAIDDVYEGRSNKLI